jgi:hypothetical protein
MHLIVLKRQKKKLELLYVKVATDWQNEEQMHDYFVHIIMEL